MEDESHGDDPSRPALYSRGASQLKTMSEAYVYLIFDRDAVPRYVGKGRGMRWRVHRSASHNKALGRLIKESDGELPIIIVRQNLTDDEAYDLEIKLILAIGRGDRGPLLNLSDGGDGVGSHTPESKAKLSAWRKGKSLPPEVRENMRLGHLGKRHSTETRAAIKATNKETALRKKREIGSPVSEITRQRMSEGAKKRDRSSGYSDEHRKAIQTGLKRFWQQRRESGLPLRHPRGQDSER